MKTSILPIYLLTLFLLVSCISPDGQMYPKTPGQLIMYGGVFHSEKEEASQDYIERETEKFGSREEASSAASAVGFDYIRDAQTPGASYAEINLAVRMFNGAWILWEDNYKVFWGYGICSALRRDLLSSEKYFLKAIALNQENPDAELRIDAALTFSPSNTRKGLDKAIELAQEALKIAPEKERAYFVWAQALANKGDYWGAWKKISQCERVGGYTIPQDFLNHLESVMPRPIIYQNTNKSVEGNAKSVAP